MSSSVPVLDLTSDGAPVALEPAAIAGGRSSFLEFKRVVDTALAVAMLVLFAPFLFFVAVVIEATSRGPAFYVQWRVGRRGRLFRMYKLRSMYSDAEERSGPVWAKDSDPRTTPIGKILRATHLDELPQLVNVIKGEMSLVGPRPERPVFVRNFTRTIPNYAARLEVRPGITGLAQVCQGYDHSLADVKRKLQYDLIYIRRMCWLVDLRIVLATLKSVVPAGAEKAAA